MERQNQNTMPASQTTTAYPYPDDAWSRAASTWCERFENVSITPRQKPPRWVQHKTYPAQQV